MKYCKKCLMPDTRPRIEFDEKGICNACNYQDYKSTIDWSKREAELETLISKNKAKNNNWDCIVAWSGGKDSTANALRLKNEFNLTPLLVTFNPLIPTEVGIHNRKIVIDYGFDSVYIAANQKVSRNLSRRFFVERGNPKVHWDAACNSSLVKIALEYNIPLIFYSEHGESEYGGNKIHDNSDKIRDYTEVIENQIGDDPMNWISNEISHKDLNFYNYPDLSRVENAGIKAVYMSYFIKWDQWKNYEYTKKYVDFKEHPNGRTEGTFTSHDSLDDKIDDLYYYMQYIKFGFGRAVRDASRMIQNNHISRAEALSLALKYDGEFPNLYLEDTLDYLNLSKDELINLIDQHRNNEIWTNDNGNWSLRYPPI